MSAAERLVVRALLPDAEFEFALVRAHSFPWPGWAASFVAGLELALSGHSHLNHSGQSCAEASAAISVETTANPATKRRPVVIASSPTFVASCAAFASYAARASLYYEDGAFWRRSLGFFAAITVSVDGIRIPT